VKCLLPYDAGNAMNTIWNRGSLLSSSRIKLSYLRQSAREGYLCESSQNRKQKKKKKINSRGDEADVNTIVNHNNMGIHAGAA